MAESDRERWNAKYLAGDHASSAPSRVLTDLAKFLPTGGRAIDVAGGAGRHAIWLAQRGLDVTLADVSDTGLQLAAERAAQSSVSLTTQQIDLEAAPFPAGPWDLIVTAHFLWRPLFDIFPSVLDRSGRLVCIHPTITNLQRHDKPPKRFLLEDGELPQLAGNLNILHYEEGWSVEGRHEAILVAER